MALHDLPAELLSLVLEALDSPTDLLSMILASAPCYHVFHDSPGLILGYVLKNVIPPVALPHALAIIHVPTNPSTDTDDPLMRNFLKIYFSSKFKLPTNILQVSELSRLFFRATRFLEDYVAKALQDLAFSGRTSNPVSLITLADPCDISATERARLQRAFFRHELYCKIFPSRSDEALDSFSPHQRSIQFNQFLIEIEPWEREEMSCVHQYYTSLIGGMLDDLENQFVEAAINTPGLQRPQLDPSPVSVGTSRIFRVGTSSAQQDALQRFNDIRGHNVGSYHHVDVGRSTDHEWDDVWGFEGMHRVGLDLFTAHGRYRSFSYVSYLASLGIDFVNRLVRAGVRERRDMIRSHLPARRDFLPEALEYGPSDSPSSPVSYTSHNNPSEYSLGWHLFRPRSEPYVLTNTSFLLSFPLRARAYVFWDDKRVSTRSFKRKLEEAKSMEPDEVDVLFRRSSGRSVEQRLRGYKIPMDERYKLVRDFGSTRRTGFDD